MPNCEIRISAALKHHETSWKIAFLHNSDSEALGQEIPFTLT